MAIQSTKCQLTWGFVVSLNLDWISNLIMKYINKKIRDKKTRLRYYLCAMVLFVCSLLHEKNTKQNASISSVQYVVNFQLNTACLSSSEIKSIKFQYIM